MLFPSQDSWKSQYFIAFYERHFQKQTFDWKKKKNCFKETYFIFIFYDLKKILFFNLKIIFLKTNLQN